MNLSMRRSKFRAPWFISCLALLVFGMLFMQSCKKEYFELDRVKDPTWNPELAVPLIQSTITIPEVLGRFEDDDIITIDPNTGLLALKYFSEVFSFNGSDWFVLPATSASGPFPVTPQDITDVANNGSVTRSFTAPIPFSVPGTEVLDRIAFSGGDFSMDLNSVTGFDADVTFTIPALTLNGTVFSSSVISLAAGNNTTFTEPLAGYVLDLTQATNNNEFEINFTIVWSGGPATAGVGINTVASVSGNNTAGGPTYSRIDGNLGSQTIDIPQGTVGLRLFDNDLGGTVIWDSAIVRGFFTNSFGIPLDINVNPFRALNSETQDSLDITGLGILSIPAASSTSNPGLSNFELVGNNNGANVNSIANLNPDDLVYHATGQTNPGGQTNNFILDSSRIKLDMEIILPFDGKAIDFSKGDTAKIDIFPLGDEIEEIVSVTLHLTIDNGFPADAFAQVIFLDSNDVVIDSVFSQPRQHIFASPTPDANGNVNQDQKVRTVTDIVLTREKLNKLEAMGMRKVATRGWVETFNQGQTRIKIFENYSLDLWLGMRVEAKVKVNL